MPGQQAVRSRKVVGNPCEPSVLTATEHASLQS